MAGQSLDGGLGYNPAIESGSSMTAAGLWSFRLAGVPAADARVQQALAWLHGHWRYDSMEGGGFVPTSTFYYLWVVTKALGASNDDGLGGALYADDFGAREPAETDFPEEPRSAYFDIAVTLLGWQNPNNGEWGNGFGGSPAGWTDESSHGFALLTLERALGGIQPDVCHAF